MENPTWARMIVVGLILAILAAGYFVFTGGFVKTKTSNNNAVEQLSPVPTTAVSSAKPSTPSAYNTILQRNQNQHAASPAPSTLPSTGFPVGLAAVFSISAAISGWGLRKYPH